jgi:DNA-binding NtrC family response regulator
MRVGLLSCSDHDCREIAAVAESIGAAVIDLGAPSAVSDTDVDVLFVAWPADASARVPIETIRRSVIPVIVLLSRYSTDLRQKAFTAGARDVLCSPVDSAEIYAEFRSLNEEEPPAESVRRAEFERLTEKLFVGASSSFKRCVEQLRKATLVDANVLLLGETGTSYGISSCVRTVSGRQLRRHS